MYKLCICVLLNINMVYVCVYMYVHTFDKYNVTQRISFVNKYIYIVATTTMLLIIKIVVI